MAYKIIKIPQIIVKKGDHFHESFVFGITSKSFQPEKQKGLMHLNIFVWNKMPCGLASILLIFLF